MNNPGTWGSAGANVPLSFTAQHPIHGETDLRDRIVSTFTAFLRRSALMSQCKSSLTASTTHHSVASSTASSGRFRTLRQMHSSLYDDVVTLGARPEIRDKPQDRVR